MGDYGGGYTPGYDDTGYDQAQGQYRGQGFDPSQGETERGFRRRSDFDEREGGGWNDPQRSDDWERRGQREHQGAYERPRDDFYGDNQPYGQGGLDSPSTGQYDTCGTAVYAPTSGEGRRFNEAQSGGYNNQAGAYSDGQSGLREESRGQYGNRTEAYDDFQNQYGDPHHGRGGVTEQHHQSSGMIGKAKEAVKELKDRL